ncbi:MAG: hypothetical protein Kapaf2KO_22500 [Candidatus Kapaibacteriales bacterium]
MRLKSLIIGLSLILSSFAFVSCESDGDSSLSANYSEDKSTSTVVYPNDRRYTDDHLWVKVDGNGFAQIGVTYVALDELGPGTFALPAPSRSDYIPSTDTSSNNSNSGTVPKGTLKDMLKRIRETEESNKKLHAPVGGIWAGRNNAYETNPDLAGIDPLGQGWIFGMSGINTADFNALMTAGEYETYIGSN